MSKSILWGFMMVLPLYVMSQKVAYVNTQEILASLPEVKQANSDLEVMRDMFQKKGKEMVSSLQSKYQMLQTKQANGEIAPIEAEKQALTLKQEEEKIAQFDQSSQEQIMKRSEELLQPITDKFDKIVDEIAKDNGYTFVFDSSQGVVLYADPSTDITKVVKTKLGIINP